MKWIVLSAVWALWTGTEQKRQKFILKWNHVFRKGRLLTHADGLILAWNNVDNRSCEGEGNIRYRRLHNNKNEHYGLTRILLQLSAALAAANPFEGSPWLRYTTRNSVPCSTA